jgi:hypothetical protein
MYVLEKRQQDAGNIKRTSDDEMPSITNHLKISIWTGFSDPVKSNDLPELQNGKANYKADSNDERPI